MSSVPATPLSPVAGGVGAAAGGGKQENVKVAIRVRPFNRREKEMGAKSVVEIGEDGKSITITDPSPVAQTSGAAAGAGGRSESNGGSSGNGKDAEAGKKTFFFDHVYGSETLQADFYTTTAKPIVEQSLKGYNGTIFAYGQTGSGKTWSMVGDEKNPGIIPLMNGDLFDRIASIKETTGRKFLVLVSYLEIYNEVVKDLLNPSDKQLMIREHPEMGIYVQDLAELVVSNAADVARLLEQGQKVRHVAATAMNDRSSRSHSCFTIKIEQKQVERIGDKEKTTTWNAKINLVDLAGSERASKTGATGDILKQGAAINKSLSALGNVINALAEGKQGKGHIPYRDSKLTRLLQHSLGGNSLTVMIATASPADDNYEETVSTLNYANRAKNIKNEAKRNEDVNEAMIRQLREEIEALRRALAAAQSSSSSSAAGGAAGLASPGGSLEGAAGAGAEPPQLSDAQKAQMEEMIANLERAKQQSWDEKQRLSQLYEEERKRNLENESKIRSVMQTIKEDNKELMRRMRVLVDERAKLTKRFKRLKEQHIGTREALAGEMARYQELVAEAEAAGEDPEAEDSPHRAELDELLNSVESLHQAIESEAAELKSLKDQIVENERQQMEARSEAAAQRMLLEEDAELRKAIQEEERAKLEKENERLLEERLEEERRKLQEDAEKERQALIAKYSERSASASASSEHEQELELSLIQAHAEKSMLLLEASQVAARHTAEIKRLKQEHKREVRELKAEELKMFREACDGFEEEKAAWEAKNAETSKLLAQAVQDIAYLQRRNAELERQLLISAIYEPGTK